MRQLRYEMRQLGSRSAGGGEPSICMMSAPVEGAFASGGGRVIDC
jgi:acyl-CoA synthetase (NDP forming)